MSSSSKAPELGHIASLNSLSPEEQYKRTLTRLQRIQGHLKTTPRGGRLQGKVCIVTGVGSLKGIGRATALLFAHQGAKALYLLDFDPKNLPDLEKTVKSSYPDVQVATLQGDAADEKTISNLCQRAIDEHGRLDVFFANAGVATATWFGDVTAETFERVMRINSLSVFLALKHASKAMLHFDPAKGKDEPGGSILMTASVAGIASGAGSLDYSASKASVINMAKTAAFQLSKTNIRVNSISPGLIETGMTVHTFDKARSRGTAGKIGQLNPLGRYGVAEEVAQLALFLASDDSSFVNGQNIAVDGGMTASMPVVPGKLA
ncbi:NAD(P)-binding protein [Exidia glandulosa HHB12029]|uniref:NAD(P)-binding protein n=1 Tax=Exidia glandulosa HHB12029 TaxID=1314781 RepID=A0A165K8L1_EXIGL|nr:NAD(P)-binding protein [Exidia glandulosa HHB12029]